MSVCPSLAYKVEEQTSWTYDRGSFVAGDKLYVRKSPAYAWTYVGSTHIIYEMNMGQFTSHILSLLDLDNNEGKPILATLDKKEVRDEGYALGSALASCFVFTYDTQAAQELGLWFAQHSGYPDMNAGFQWIMGFVQGLVDGNTARNRLQIPQRNGEKQKE